MLLHGGRTGDRAQVGRAHAHLLRAGRPRRVPRKVADSLGGRRRPLSFRGWFGGRVAGGHRAAGDPAPGAGGAAVRGGVALACRGASALTWARGKPPALQRGEAQRRPGCRGALGASAGDVADPGRLPPARPPRGPDPGLASRGRGARPPLVTWAPGPPFASMPWKKSGSP